MASIRKAGGAAGAVCSVAAIIAIVLSHGQVRTNERGLELIGNAEACRRDPYVCPAGVLTDGIGNTHNVTGKRKTDEEIAQDWQRNIRTSETCVDTYFNGKRLSDNTFSAMTSAVFNLGCSGLRWNSKAARPTMIAVAAQGGRFAEMCNRLPEFSNPASIPGIKARRLKERELCLDGLK